MNFYICLRSSFSTTLVLGGFYPYAVVTLNRLHFSSTKTVKTSQAFDAIVRKNVFLSYA